MKLNESGAKVIRKPSVKKPPVKTPRELMQALRMNKKANLKFSELSESNKRHYVDWVTNAKTEETRERRLEQAVDAIAAGKKRHWD